MSNGTTAHRRVITEDALSLELEPDDLAPGSVVTGDPSVSSRTLDDGLGVQVGIWQLTVGTVTDTEVDEVFVVLAGAGTVAFTDGSEIVLAPGTVVRLHAGDRTTWTVRETLRKIYIA